jgi:tRNA threonylcarbamoyl adenosine modification protein (Sua5/YciO/YrdC/YwlC family)
MIEYIVPGNIDDRILARAVTYLGAGRLLALPTDTSWSIACSLRSQEGIRKLRQVSGERDERRFTILCSAISQFGEFCSLDNTRFRLIKRLSPGPYLFILKTLLSTEKTLRRREVGIRIPDHPVPQGIINTLGCPLYSITAKRSQMPWTEESAGTAFPPIREEELFEGGWELEELEGVDLILDPGEEQQRIFSSVLDMSGDEVTLLRSGAGVWPV